MKYILLFLIILIGGMNPISCQVVSSKKAVGYNQNEIDIKVNGYNVNTPYKRNLFIQKVGSDYTEFIDSNDKIFLEFEYNIYEFRYRESSIIVNDENGVMDIQINDKSLSINGIKVGDTVDKVKETFSKHNQYDNRIVIFYAGSSLSFYPDSQGIIKRITYFVPT